MRNRYKLKGITLLETLLYIAIFSSILFVIIGFMLSTQEASLRNERRSNIHQTSQFVIQHFSDTFTKIREIDINSSVFNNDNGLLSYSYSDGNHKYSLINGKLVYDFTPITPSNIIITKFSIEPLYNRKNIISAVRVTYKMSSVGDTQVTSEFTNLYVIR